MIYPTRDLIKKEADLNKKWILKRAIIHGILNTSQEVYYPWDLKHFFYMKVHENDKHFPRNQNPNMAFLFLKISNMSCPRRKKSISGIFPG